MVANLKKGGECAVFLSRYYETLDSLLSEAAAYVEADVDRRNRGDIYPTPAMQDHFNQFKLLTRFINDELVFKLGIAGVMESERLFAMLVDTTTRVYTASKESSRKEKCEMRAIPNRIDSYREIIREQREKGEVISLDEIEEIYRSRCGIL